MKVHGFASLAIASSLLFIGAPADARTLEHRAVINAPVADVWSAFTNPDDVQTWMCAHAEIDLSVGGLFKTNYNPNGEIGDATTIVNEIISYEPERMLSIRNVQVPEGFPWELNFQQTWSVMYFEPLGPDRTELRLVGMGYGEGEEWEALYKFFEDGNAWTINELKKKFGQDAEGAEDDVLDTLGALVGGEWIHESETPRGVFRVRNVLWHGPDGKSIIGKGWLGDGEGMFEHGATTVYRDALTGRVRFLNVNENGHVAQGDITMGDDGAVLWDWNQINDAGTVTRYDARMLFDPENHDRYHFTLARIRPDGSRMPMVDIWYDRVEKAPERFTRLKSATVTQR